MPALHIYDIIFPLFPMFLHRTIIFLPMSLFFSVQVQCTILDARGWCTGMTQKEGMGREEGGGFRMGNTGIPVADSFRYLAKLIQYFKV